MKRLLTGLGLGLAAAVLAVMPVGAASNVSVNFESPTYVIGSINSQDGWMKTGPYDAGVVANTYSFPSFGAQTFRISDAVTSGSFGDQTFAKPLTDGVGEVDSTFGSYPTTSLEKHFEMQFDMATTMATQQVGSHVSISPDRGDGSRMSYLRLEDGVGGVSVFFVDVEGADSPANFVETQIGTDLSRTVPHALKLTLDTLDGSSNDVVKVWIDGVLVHTGTSWENYYRNDPESASEPSPRVVRTVLFRESGDATLAHSGEGFLFDNISLSSGPIPVEPPVPVGPPTNKDQCKNYGWKIFNNPSFKNQGLCVSYVVSKRSQ